MIELERMFHTGVRVPSLATAMGELGPALGLTWAEPRVGNQDVWTPRAGAGTADLRFTYSVQGPQHVELVEGPPGTVWFAGESPGVHHIGVWVDDVGAEAARLLEEGWTVVAAQKSPDAGYGAFAYLAPPSGLIVELVDTRVQPAFEAWWSGR